MKSTVFCSFFVIYICERGLRGRRLFFVPVDWEKVNTRSGGSFVAIKLCGGNAIDELSRNKIVPKRGQLRLFYRLVSLWKAFGLVGFCRDIVEWIGWKW